MNDSGIELWHKHQKISKIYNIMGINKSSNIWKLHQEKCRNVFYITDILFQFYNFNWIMNN